MSEIKVILKGFTKKITEKEWIASPNVILIKDSGKNILVDPGANPKLPDALKKEGIKIEDIDMIFITHYHPDHLLNIRFFPNTDVAEGDLIHRNEKEFAFSNKIPGTNISVIPTPGHAHEHSSLIVKTKNGKICLAGDLWFWENGEEQKTDFNSLIKREDPFVKDKKALIKSRKKVLEISDYIFPAHGKMFKVEKK